MTVRELIKILQTKDQSMVIAIEQNNGKNIIQDYITLTKEEINEVSGRKISCPLLSNTPVYDITIQTKPDTTILALGHVAPILLKKVRLNGLNSENEKVNYGKGN